MYFPIPALAATLIGSLAFVLFLILNIRMFSDLNKFIGNILLVLTMVVCTHLFGFYRQQYVIHDRNKLFKFVCHQIIESLESNNNPQLSKLLREYLETKTNSDRDALISLGEELESMRR
jgi:hypothetical protein